MLRLLADEIQPPERPTDTPPSPAIPQQPAWSGLIPQLKPLLVDVPAAFKMMDLTCAKPGVRVGFKEVVAASGRSWGEARADLATLSRIAKRLGQSSWPVHAEKVNGLWMYDASAEVAAAWNAAA